MKTLIICYSLTGKTKQICTVMKRCLGATLATLSETRDRTTVGAYIFGSLAARSRKASHTTPLDVDIADYNQIIVAGPVWAGFPAPALNDFIRQYDLEEKRLYGLLTSASGNADKARRAMEEEVEAAQARLKNVLTLRSDRETVRALKGGRRSFAFDEEGLLCIVKN